MTKFRDIRVVLRSPDGHYIAGGPTEWEFTDNLAEAAVFDYLADEIETQLEAITKSQSLVFEAIHVASLELQEICDRCDKTVPQTLVFFNGKQFLCRECRDAGPEALPA